MRLVFALIVLCLVSGCICSPCTLMEQWDCEEKGGWWGYIGLSPEEECNLPTGDGGKECSDSADCEGDCLADLTEEEYEKAWDGEVIETNGTCTSWRITVGCQAFVEQGKVYAILCVD